MIPASDFFLTRDVSVRGDVSLKTRVHILLLRLGKNQGWLADECSINAGTLSKILNNHWESTAQVKLRMAQALECDSLVLFGAVPYWLDYQKSFKVVRNGE